MTHCPPCLARLICCWALLVAGLMAPGLQAAEDDLSTLVAGDVESLRQQIRRTAQLPGGDAIRAAADAPVLLWSERCFLGTDNVYSGEGIRYVVVRLQVGNATDSDLVLHREKVTLYAGTRSFQLGNRPSSFRDIPLEIDWHRDGHLRPQSQLKTPRVIEIPKGKSVTFWCVFVGLDPVPAVPPMIVKVEFDGGRHAELDLNSQQRARLGLNRQRLGPANTLAVMTIQGQLNRVNAADLATELNKAAGDGVSRFLIEWSSQAQPSDEVLYSWLMASTLAEGRDNLLFLQLPMLPPMQRLVLAQVPAENRDVFSDWVEAKGHVFNRPQDAVASVLEDVFERVDVNSLQREIRSGHPWSRQAALKVAGNRLPPSSLQLIVDLVKGGEFDVRQGAILALGAQGSETAANELKRLVLSKDQGDVEASLMSLLASSNQQSRATVRELLDQSALALPKNRILKLLADSYHPDWDFYLVRSVQDPDPQVRCAALEVLQRLGHRQLTDFCISGLEDPSNAVREVAFQVLVDGHDRRCQQAALTYALDRLRAGEISEPALRLIERMRETRAAPLLLQQLGKPGASRVRLVQTLGEVGTGQHLQSLMGRLSEFSVEEQVSILDLASRMSVADQLDVARKMAFSKEAPLRYSAVEILKSVGNDEAIAILVEMLEKPRNDELEMICLGLGEIGTEEAVRQLRVYREKSVVAGQADALQAVEQGLRIWRNRLPGWNYVESGFLHSEAGQDDEALKAYSLALLINPDLSDAYASRANIYLRQEKYKEASADYTEALRLDSFNDQAVTGMAIIQAIGGKWEEAIALVHKQAGHFSRNKYYAYNTACVYGRAIEYLRKQPASEARDRTIAEMQTEAISKLRASVEYGFSQFDWMQKDPDLASLRDLPGFKELLRDD